MSFAGLSLGNTPPLQVPLRFFVTAPLFLFLAGVLLLTAGWWSVPGRWSPLWLALTHLWVVGFMLMVMLGALQQVIPVLLGSALPGARAVAFWGHLLLVAGTLSLVWGFLSEWKLCFVLAAALLPAAVLLVGGTACVALGRSPSRHASRLSLALALAALGFTLVIGSWLALGHGGLAVLARRYTDLHLGWGLLGWTVLLVSGVAWQVVPMFQITPRYPLVMMRWFGALHFLALSVWSVARWRLDAPWLQWVGAAWLSVSLALFAAITLRLQAKRRRRVADSTLDFWRLSMISLLLAVLSWWARRMGILLPAPLPAILFVTGFVGSAILGMLYKIVPFLVWLHLTNRAQASGVVPRGLPNMKQVIPNERSKRLFRLYTAWLPLSWAAPFRMEWLGPPAGLLLMAVALVLARHLHQAVRLYRRRRRGLERGNGSHAASFHSP